MLIKKIFTILVLCIAGAVIFTSCTPSEKFLKNKIRSTGASTGYVRVLINKETSSFKISSSSGVRVIDKKTAKVIYECEKGGLIFYPEKINDIYIIETGKEPVYVNANGYRGSLELHNILGKIYIINVVSMEEYLYSVVPSEMPSSWNIEALKSQAVASRTYSFYHITKTGSSKNIYDLDATTNFQVYKGIVSEKPLSTRAVSETAGLIMTYNNEPILAYFHSTSGGKTSDDKYVWRGDDLPYLNSVECQYEKESPYHEWTTELTLAEIETALKNKYQRIGAVKKISFKKYDDRVIEVTITHTNGNIVLTGNEFRLMLQSGKLKSTYFTAKQQNNSFHIYGRGWGHGVGMCQWDAKGRGESGFSYEQILKHYYGAVKLTRINNNYLAHKRGSGNLVN